MNIVARVCNAGVMVFARRARRSVTPPAAVLSIAIALLPLVCAAVAGAQENDRPSATDMPALDVPPAHSAASEQTAQSGDRSATPNDAPTPPRSTIAVTRVAYQGYLTNAGGAPINGVVSISATLYNAPSGGSALWTELHNSVAVSNGVFQIVLGSITALEVPDFTGSPVYLGVSVNGEAELPRTQLVASPFAIRAAEADHALTADIASDGLWTVAGSNIYRAGGNVGIGASSPSAKLEVLGAGASGLSLKADTLLYVNATTPFVGVGRSTPVTGADRFAVRSAATSGYGGMYVETQGTSAWPFYGYATAGVARAWHLYDGATGNWSLFNAGLARLTVESGGNVGIGQTDPAHKLDVLQSTGGGLGNVAIHAQHTGSSGIALSAETTSNDATVVFEQDGTGDIVRCFKSGGLVFRVLNDGQVVTPVLQITGGADLVESFDTHDERSEPGTVLVIDEHAPGRLESSTYAYDAKVAGVVSGANGVRPGIHMGQEGTLDGATPVAMAGRVYVKCSTENGAIRPGDLLTTAAMAGHAMRATDPARSNGAIIGKAMSSLDHGDGLVLVLVNLQ